MLPIILPQAQCVEIHADASTGAEIEVDLTKSQIKLSSGKTIAFTVDAFRRNCLLEGLDDIGITLKKSQAIASFEKSRTATWPWLDGLGYVKIGEKNALVPAASAAATAAAPGSPPKPTKIDW